MARAPARASCLHTRVHTKTLSATHNSFHALPSSGIKWPRFIAERGHWASFALATFDRQPRRPCKRENKERSMNELVSVTHLQQKKNEPLVTANLPTSRSPSCSPRPRLWYPHHWAFLGRVATRPAPQRPAKHQNMRRELLETWHDAAS